MSVVRKLALVAPEEVMVEVILPVACPLLRRAKARSSPPRRGRLVIERQRW